jgi:glycosyltransferase involved in cell wall biosynthesis
MEADVVAATVANACAQGVERVYVVDNASPDDTVHEAVRAGAILGESYATTRYDETLRITLMNALVARVSAAEPAEHIWWLWLDADEFPRGPGGQTIQQYLSGLDRRFRIVGARYYNHFPDGSPANIPGFHPIDFQPRCEPFVELWPMCERGHWKHPLQRFDRHGAFVAAQIGFHAATVMRAERLVEPDDGIITHHFHYRDEAITRERFRLLRETRRDGSGARIDGAAHGMRQRYDGLDAVYAGRWHLVPDLRGADGRGVNPVLWEELAEPDDRPVPRWYSDEQLAAARAAVAALRSTSTG